MSNIMVSLDRGLTEQEIVKIVYDETNKAGEPVPCSCGVMCSQGGSVLAAY